jgi:hypothetical protein
MHVARLLVYDKDIVPIVILNLGYSVEIKVSGGFDIHGIDVS